MTEIIVTDEALEQREPATPHEIVLSTHRDTFTGWLLATSTTKTERSQRWTDMRLYRIKNPRTAARYVLVIEGPSVVYHLPGWKCSSGEDYLASELPDAARPCRSCLPGGRRPAAGTRVVFERDILSVYHCADAAAVIRDLLDNSRSKKEGPGAGRGNDKRVASQPAEDLLYEAAELDSAFDPDHLEIQL